jgi:hypothetical protein
MRIPLYERTVKTFAPAREGQEPCAFVEVDDAHYTRRGAHMPLETVDDAGRPVVLEVPMLLRLAQQGGSGVHVVSKAQAP